MVRKFFLVVGIAVVSAAFATSVEAEQQISTFGILASSQNVEDFNACRISSRETDDKPDLILLLNCRDQAGQRFPIPVAAQYRAHRHSWYFIAENGAEIPNQTICNVFAVSPSAGTTPYVRSIEGFVHHATAENTSKDGSKINHRSCNQQKDAVVLVTERPTTGMSNWPSVEHVNGQWQIPFSRSGSEYNVVVCKPGKFELGDFGKIEAFTHTVTAESLKDEASTLHDLTGKTFNDSLSFVFVTPQQTQCDDAQPTFRADDGQRGWAIKSSRLKVGQKFSVMVVTRLTY